MDAPVEASKARRVGLVCTDPAVAEIVIRSLKGFADVRKLDEPPPEDLKKLDALILWFGDPAEPSVRFLARDGAE